MEKDFQEAGCCPGYNISQKHTYLELIPKRNVCGTWFEDGRENKGHFKNLLKTVGVEQVKGIEENS